MNYSPKNQMNFQTGFQSESDWLSKLPSPKTSPEKRNIGEALATSSDWVDSPKQTGLQSESDWGDSLKQIGVTVRSSLNQIGQRDLYFRNKRDIVTRTRDI